MEKLKQLLEKVKPDLTYEQLESWFKEIANHILGQFVIVNHGKKYWITDIEFYYYNHQVLDARANDSKKTITYPRTCISGVWFFHSSGMDLCFESDKSKGFGGGILIREMRESTNPDVEISGPINVYNELFGYYVDAIFPILYPFIEKADSKLNGLIENDVRVHTKHIDKDQLKLRFKLEI